MNKKQIKMLVRIITAAVLMIALTVLAKFVTLNRWVEFILFMVPYLVIGYDILKKAGNGKDYIDFAKDSFDSYQSGDLIKVTIYSKNSEYSTYVFYIRDGKLVDQTEAEELLDEQESTEDGLNTEKICRVTGKRIKTWSMLFCLGGIIDFIKLGAGIIIVSVFFIILLVFHLVDMTINRDKYRV